MFDALFGKKPAGESTPPPAQPESQPSTSGAMPTVSSTPRALADFQFGDEVKAGQDQLTGFCEIKRGGGGLAPCTWRVEKAATAGPRYRIHF